MRSKTIANRQASLMRARNAAIEEIVELRGKVSTYQAVLEKMAGAFAEIRLHLKYGDIESAMEIIKWVEGDRATPPPKFVQLAKAAFDETKAVD